MNTEWSCIMSLRGGWNVPLIRVLSLPVLPSCCSRNTEPHNNTQSYKGVLASCAQSSSCLTVSDDRALQMYGPCLLESWKTKVLQVLITTCSIQTCAHLSITQTVGTAKDTFTPTSVCCNCYGFSWKIVYLEDSSKSGSVAWQAGT